MAVTPTRETSVAAERRPHLVDTGSGEVTRARSPPGRGVHRLRRTGGYRSPPIGKGHGATVRNGGHPLAVRATVNIDHHGGFGADSVVVVGTGPLERRVTSLRPGLTIEISPVAPTRTRCARPPIGSRRRRPPWRSRRRGGGRSPPPGPPPAGTTGPGGGSRGQALRAGTRWRSDDGRLARRHVSRRGPRGSRCAVAAPPP